MTYTHFFFSLFCEFQLLFITYSCFTSYCFELWFYVFVILLDIFFPFAFLRGFFEFEFEVDPLMAWTWN